MIERNRNPAGRLSNVVFGLASLLDGLVRVVSLGWLHTDLPLSVSRWQVKSHIKALKRRQGRASA